MSWLTDLFKDEDTNVLEDKLKKQAKQTALQEIAKSSPDYSNPMPQPPSGTTFQGMMEQGKAMQPNALAQIIAENSRGNSFAGQPSIMPNVDLGTVDVKKPKSKLSETVKGQENFISRLPAEAGKFMQSIGYGMLDRPLGRDASTWDYLGKTIGQIARVGEGSGLGTGESIQNDTTVQYNNLQQDLLKIPDTIVADPEKKMVTYRELLRKYPKLQSFLSEYFGLTRSYDYNYPQGPAPKYQLGAPGSGAPAGVE